MRYVVGPASSIARGTVKIVYPYAGEPGIGVFNIGGEFFALRNLCPHMGAPLCEGRIDGTSMATTRADGAPEMTWVRDGEVVVCPWHRWEFNIKSGRTIFPSRSRARRYEVATEDPEVVERLRAGAETVRVTVDDAVVVLEL